MKKSSVFLDCVKENVVHIIVIILILATCFGLIYFRCDFDDVLPDEPYESLEMEYLDLARKYVKGEKIESMPKNVKIEADADKVIVKHTKKGIELKYSLKSRKEDYSWKYRPKESGIIKAICYCLISGYTIYIVLDMGMIQNCTVIKHKYYEENYCVNCEYWRDEGDKTNGCKSCTIYVGDYCKHRKCKRDHYYTSKNNGDIGKSN